MDMQGDDAKKIKLIKKHIWQMDLLWTDADDNNIK